MKIFAFFMPGSLQKPDQKAILVLANHSPL